MVQNLLSVASLACFCVLTAASGENYDQRTEYRRSYPPRSPRTSFICNVNEVWSPCPAAVCAPKTCNDVGFPVPCYDLAPNGECPTKPACICKEGFVRDRRGVCISMELCPSCGGDPFARSGCGNCNPTCSNYDRNDIVCTQQCNYNSCNCLKGYVLDEVKKICVKPSQCPPRKVCRRNEVYDLCPSSCPPRVCGINDAAVSCARPLPVGHPNCRPACRCKDGYLLNHKGHCVLPQHCPRCTKRPNERYDPCPALCPPKRCDVDPAVILCAVPPQLGDPACRPSCQCEDGYLRNQTGICIRKEECPRCPKPHQVYDPCLNYCSMKRCDVDERLIKCAAPLPEGDPRCEGGCRCADGYKMNEDGNCVLPDQCYPQCPINEEYSKCTQTIDRPQKCSELGFPKDLPEIDPAHCQQGCVCKEGFVRNERGRCIPAEKCPSCGGDEGKITGCGIYCNQRCRDIGQEPRACIALCIRNSCNCRSGLYLDENTGLCVPPNQCTPQCAENEFYSTCVQGNCSPQNCTQVGLPIACPLIIAKYCKKGCLCKEGYARDASGKCVPIDKCPRKCPINEEFSKCTQTIDRPQKCSELGFPIDLPEIDPADCQQGCVCQDGFVRNERGKCIPVDKCPSCGGDEGKVAGCGVYCNQRCRDVGKPIHPCILLCVRNSCNCRSGLYLDENTGLCVQPNKCTQQCSENEYYSTCIQGSCTPQDCTQVGSPIACPRIRPEFCKTGCLCKEGYARDTTGRCVPINECPLRCPSGEVFSPCINGGCQARNCSQYGQDVPCKKMDPKYCIAGCVCPENYLRNYNGQCVPANQCPEACNGPNEEYLECSYNCPPRTCDSLDKAYACPIQNGENCRPICTCKPGFYRNILGNCVTEQQCRQCPGPFEGYACGGACDNVCKTLHLQSKDNCPIINIRCNDICYCADGYARALNNTCIPINRCNEPQCPINEHYELCPGANCQPQYCSQLGFPIPCDIGENKPCSTRAGCVCNDGLVRNDNGTCIPKEQCPSCGGDERARSGCGVNCLKKCRDIGKGPQPCLKICHGNSCDCIDGYYYDANKKKCVPSNQCTDICDKNEVFEDCTNPVCRAETCSELGFPLNCTKPCKKRCICQNGYVRDENGVCIPAEQCPSCGGDANAQLGCKFNCNRRCPNNAINPRICPRIACTPQLNQCQCRDGYLYDINTNSCVKPEECSPRCNPDNNEIYSPCSNGGCDWKNCTQVGGPKICINPYVCIKGCDCKEGYYRLENGTCVPESQCPKKCGPNEYYHCGSACDDVCGKLDTESKYNCPIKNKRCVSRCYCKDGFARNQYGRCIPVDKCPYSPTTVASINVDNAIAKFEKGNQALAGQFLYYLQRSRPGENFMISGFSVLVALAQLALNANGVTLEQLMRLLNLDYKDEIRVVFPELIRNYKLQQNVIFTLAVKYYSNKNYPFSEEFVRDSRNVFGSDLESLDFSQNVQAAGIINRWVEDNTNGLIKDLVNADMFNADTRCALVNALYFLGDWQKQFDERNTVLRDFFLDETTSVPVKTMFQQGMFEYGESDDLDCQILKLPYKGGNFSFTIFLPRQRGGLQTMIEKLTVPSYFANGLNSLSPKTVRVYLPVTDFETNISDLPDLLKMVNLTEPFNPNSNGFQGILQNNEPLYISDAIQKTKLKVNEKGTEAAAATAAILMTRSFVLPPTEIVTFDANHPFAFFITIDNFIVLGGCRNQ